MNNLKTLEVIAKYIGERTGLKVHLQANVVPHANPETMEMWLPTNVTDEHIFPAIALAMHEAGHIKHTRFDSKRMASNDTEFAILNAMEDARIDVKNFRLLPNIRSFYQELYKHLREKHKNLEATLPPEPLSLCDCIMRYEGFSDFTSRRLDVWSLADKIEPLFNDGVRYLDAGMHDNVRDKIQKILAIFNINKQKAPPSDTDKEGKHGEQKDTNSASRKGSKAQESEQPGHGENATREGNEFKEIIKKFTRDSSAIALDPNTATTAGNPVDPLAMTEATRGRFEEMLKVKEEKLLSSEEGVLNTDSLTSFFTGDVKDLFSDIRINTPKKSRIILVLDASGSMLNPLWDGQPRHHVVKAAVKSVIRSIESVNKAEGLCVDWEIAGFEAGLIPMKKETWETEYCPKGGTNIVNAFQQAQEHLMKDAEANGNKIMIFITDGEVRPAAVETLNEMILRNNSQIKLVIIGVGADPAGEFCKRVVAGRNILDASTADRVLFDAISVCLEN